MDEGWDEPETAWWAKHQHAQDHLERLRGVCAEYRSTKPLEVRPESTDVPVFWRPWGSVTVHSCPTMGLGPSSPRKGFGKASHRVNSCVEWF